MKFTHIHICQCQIVTTIKSCFKTNLHIGFVQHKQISWTGYYGQYIADICLNIKLLQSFDKISFLQGSYIAANNTVAQWTQNEKYLK